MVENKNAISKKFVIFFLIFIIYYFSLAFAGQCAGRCGEYDPQASCKCDNVCMNYGDCCRDICIDCPTHPACSGATTNIRYTTTISTTIPASCKGRCGYYNPQASCQCDNVCHFYKGSYGCCSDICTYCPTHPACSKVTTTTTIITTTTVPYSYCYDSDGMDIYTKGYVYSYSSTDKKYYTSYDYCASYDNYTLIEYYCGGVYDPQSKQYIMSAHSLVIPCQNGCYDGRCLSGITTTTTTIIPNYCNDTDGGYNIYQKGYVSGYSYGSYYNYVDYCSGNYVFEYYCSGNYPYSLSAYCKQGCFDGRCLKSGITTTTTIPTTILTTITTTITNSCKDSDGGSSIYTKGKVYGYLNGKYYSYSDYCSGNYVVEYYCSGDYYYTSNYYCLYGCSDGKCLSSSTPTTIASNYCSETDGGYSIYSRGTTYGYYNSNYFEYKDYCNGNYLYEYFCINGVPQIGSTYCTYGCSNGACKVA